MIIQLNKLPRIALPFEYKLTILNNNIYIIPFDKNIDTTMIKNNIVKTIETNDGFAFTSRAFKADNSIVYVNDIAIGGDDFTLIGGPCSVDTENNLIDTAQLLKNTKTPLMRAGVFKPRTSPFSFQGVQVAGLDYLQKIRNDFDLPVVVELTSAQQVIDYADLVDMIQIGSRNMQNFELLKAVGKTNKPVLLKRGFQATIKEFLYSAEYIMAEGNPNVVLCERGVRSFESSYRNMIDINAIIYLKQMTHLPVLIDPSHGTGVDWMVNKATLAGLAAGCDGAIIEVHTNKEQALSDKDQTLTSKQYIKLVEDVNKLNNCFNK
ncbi:3-deoxy-7-phosphoheptulonate synthase [Mycoplasma sp. P36-A1]|uniref:3-deoxy-7-phosphoheptulonate synthase n=1 Tax=Mycoplasma sp. P36-A1 TaxID=3252900 RepID=UPI003C2BC594